MGQMGRFGKSLALGPGLEVDLIRKRRCPAPIAEVVQIDGRRSLAGSVDELITRNVGGSPVLPESLAGGDEDERAGDGAVLLVGEFDGHRSRLRLCRRL